MKDYNYAVPVSSADEGARVAFIRKTYQHLAFAILGFAGMEFLLIDSPLASAMVARMTGGFSWLIVLGAFMGVSWIANRWALSSTSRRMQYAGLITFVVAESIIFLPLLFIARMYDANIIPMAGIFTLFLFGALTYTAFTSGKDFSFLGGALKIGGIVAIGVIVASMIFGFSLGILFSAAMILFAGGAILYDTSNIMRHYNTDQHVAASLSLFASVALLFWYIIQFFMALSSD
ncbi:MAG: US12 family protein [Deltaproteobacteria bacterium]|nr:US12 family protein [Deltaproteobacteria bacterium]